MLEAQLCVKGAPHSLWSGGVTGSLVQLPRLSLLCQPGEHGLCRHRWGAWHLRPPVSGVSGKREFVGKCRWRVWKLSGPAVEPTEIGLQVPASVSFTTCNEINLQLFYCLLTLFLHCNSSFCVFLFTHKQWSSQFYHLSLADALCTVPDDYFLTFPFFSGFHYSLPTPHSWLMTLLSTFLRKHRDQERTSSFSHQAIYQCTELLL